MRPKQTYMLGWLVSYTQQTKYIFKRYYTLKSKEQKDFMYRPGDYIPKLATVRRI